MKRVGRLRLGRLLAFGIADCLGAIGHTSAQLGPVAAQSAHPCLGRLLSLGLAYPGTNPPTVAPKAVKVPRSFDRGDFAVFHLSPVIFRIRWPHRMRHSKLVDQFGDHTRPTKVSSDLIRVTPDSFPCSVK